MNTYRALLILSLFFTSLVSKSQIPVISTITNQVSIDTLINHAKDITGERNVIVKGVTGKINSRHKDFAGNELTFQYILEKFISYGLTTDSLLFGIKGKNAWAVQPGNVYPNRYYILCAHYDGMPPMPIAPAAEDNASGVVTVLEAARILSKYKFEYTIVYALWDEEEQGLLGSKAYAENAAANQDSVAGVINLDMIAWDGNADNLARIASKNIASFRISDSIVAVNTNYKIGLNFITKIPLASGNSDQASFWDKGFGAVHVIEDFENDRSPHYHLASDSVKYLTRPYFEKMAKLVIASMATLAVPMKTSDIENSEEYLSSITFYPNPTSGILQIRGGNGILADAKVSLYGIWGEVLVTVNSKYETINMDLSSYPDGMYFLNIQTDKGITVKKIIITGN